MANLSSEQSRRLLDDVLDAGIAWDPAALVASIQPVFTTGDAEDLYQLIQGLVTVVAGAFPRSQPCPIHGEDGHRSAFTFGVLPVTDGAPDWSAHGEGSTPSLPPGFESTHPEMVAYVRLVVAALSNDEGMFAAIWNAAVISGHGPEVLYRAIEVASQTLRDAQAGPS